MTIDARGIELKELFARLKEILSTDGRCGDVCIEILLDTLDAAQKVRAFVSMTGCQTEIKEKEGRYVLYVTGNPCCV
jgi:translation initiation factor 1 (eIF-1/SUI1)